jgi:hypothetical protein
MDLATAKEENADSPVPLNIFNNNAQDGGENTLAVSALVLTF